MLSFQIEEVILNNNPIQCSLHYVKLVFSFEYSMLIVFVSHTVLKLKFVVLNGNL